MKVGESCFNMVLIEDLGIKEVKGKRERYGLFKCHCGNIKEIKMLVW